MRLVAHRKQCTLNTVVIECLMENLPPVSLVDMGVAHGVSFFTQTEQQLVAGISACLERYLKEKQQEISLLGELVILKNQQTQDALAMEKTIRTGGTVKLADEEGNHPFEHTEDGKLSPEFLHYLDSSRLRKIEKRVLECSKEMARHQYDALGQWNIMKEKLEMLENLRLHSKDKP